MQNKRSPWMSIVLGLMLFSLIIFSGLPLVNSIFRENELFTGSDSTNGISLEQKAQWEAEANGYEKVLLREPENETALRELLNIRLQQQDIDAAIAPLASLVKIHPERSEYGVLLGQAKQYRNDNEGAASAFKAVLANSPGNIMALGGLVNLFLNQNLTERAIALLQDTLSEAKAKEDSNLDLNSIELLLGEVYVEAENYPEAISIYDRIATADTSDFRPLMAKALVLQKQEKTAEANSLLESAYELAPAEFKDQIKQAMSDA